MSDSYLLIKNTFIKKWKRHLNLKTKENLLISGTIIPPKNSVIKESLNKNIKYNYSKIRINIFNHKTTLYLNTSFRRKAIVRRFERIIRKQNRYSRRCHGNHGTTV